jgi:type VI secretion system protein ImpA
MSAGIGNIHVEDFLLEVTPEAPCGVDLEYDSAFLELEQASKGKEESQFGTPEIPPDWKEVYTIAHDLLARSRDLRVAVLLARAALKLQGHAGFASGLALIEQLLEHRWACVHPQLDADDGNDPTMRVNTLALLCEQGTVLRDVREAELVSSRQCGHFSLRDVDLATGELDKHAGETAPAVSMIDAAFLDADAAAVQATLAALEQSHASVGRIETILTSHVGAAQAMDLGALTRMLRRARDFVRARSGAAQPGAPAQTAIADAVPAAAPQPAAAVISADIRSRDDVRRVLEKICAYYAQHEPSSPIPLLLVRAQRLMDKSFLEIMQDLAPDGLTQVHTISGTSSET